MSQPASEEKPLFGPIAVALASFFGMNLAGGILVALNARALGRPRAAVVPLAISLALLGVDLVPFFAGWTKTSWAHTLSLFVTSTVFAWWFTRHNPPRPRRSAVWTVLITLGCMFAVIGAMLPTMVKRVYEQYPRAVLPSGAEAFYGSPADLPRAERLAEWVADNLRGGTRDFHVALDTVDGIETVGFIHAHESLGVVYDHYRAAAQLILEGLYGGDSHAVAFRLCTDLTRSRCMPITP